MNMNRVMLLLVVVGFIFYAHDLRAQAIETEAEVLDDTCPINMQDQDINGSRAKIRRDEQGILRNAESDEPKKSAISAARERLQEEAGQPSEEVSTGNGDNSEGQYTNNSGIRTGTVGNSNTEDRDVSSGNVRTGQAETAVENSGGSSTEISDAARNSRTALPTPQPKPSPTPLPSTSTVAGNMVGEDGKPLLAATGNWNAAVTYNSRIEMYQRIMGP